MTRIHIGIVGGGPSALFLYRALLESERNDFSIEIFEAGPQLGAGMPYGRRGACLEHVTNISGNEIPPLAESVIDWVRSQSRATLAEFGIDPDQLTEFKVLPRLLFGRYLADQFNRYLAQGRDRGIPTQVWLKTPVVDVKHDRETGISTIVLPDRSERRFDVVILCTGHHWPRSHEGKIPNYFDSPYPPLKLEGFRNHPIAIRGASLTAIDAIRTLARNHGEFLAVGKHRLRYVPHPEAHAFKIVMHSREGFLPGIRFHLDDPRLRQRAGLSEAEIEAHRQQNNGFISLDYLFEQDFKQSLREDDPKFFEQIKTLSLEDFVALMTKERERSEPFEFFRHEYREAAESIRNEESIHWKERLAVLSFSLNRPAKHFSAEDTIRLREVLRPLISVVIAFTPQSSCEELLALHEAGVLELRSVGAGSHVEPQPDGGVLYFYTTPDGEEHPMRFQTFIDCIGQQPLSYAEFPFEALKRVGAVSQAYIRFRSREQALERLNSGVDDVRLQGDEAWLQVPGVAISDQFEAINAHRKPNCRLYVMAVPLMGGHNPDYSGLDFCEEASGRIVPQILRTARLAPSSTRLECPSPPTTRVQPSPSAS